MSVVPFSGVPWYVTAALENDRVQRFGGPMTFHKASSGARGMSRAVKRARSWLSRSGPRQKRSKGNGSGNRDMSSRSSRGSVSSGGRSSRSYRPSSYSGSSSWRSGATGIHHARGRTHLGKRRRRNTGRKKSLKKRVIALEKNRPKLATHDFRRHDPNYLANAINECNYLVMSAYTIGLREGAIDDLQFMDRAATPALDSLDLTNTNVTMNIKFEDIYSKIVIRNNNRMPVDIDCYLCRSKSVHSYTPRQALSGADDKYGITDALTNVLTFPSDFDLFKSHWDIAKHEKGRLQAGDEMVQICSKKTDSYDPENVDDESSPTYIRGDLVWLVRISGVVSHDTTVEETVGLGDGQVDCVNTVKFKVKYPSDAPFYKIETDSNLGVIADAEAAGPNVQGSLQDDHN